MPNIVNNTTLPNFLDLIAPHSCRGCGHLGEVVCSRCKKNIISQAINLCPFCKHPLKNCRCNLSQNLPPIQIISWRKSLVGTLIHDLKYHSTRSIAKSLANILCQTLVLPSTPLRIIPLPTNHQHIRKRGLDHTLLISKHLAKQLGESVKVSRLLLRNNTATQVGSSRKERINQAKNAYIINQTIKIEKNATYLLLDDVWTTGASVISATKILRQSNISKLIIVILSLSD